MNLAEDPQHPILDQAWQYEIVGFEYRAPLDGSEAHIDLTLHRDGDVRRLRFFSPRDVVVDHGFFFTHGLDILDVRVRSLDGIGVRVTDIENCEGGVEFWARDVIDVTPH